MAALFAFIGQLNSVELAFNKKHAGRSVSVWPVLVFDN
jgi:hypothetical protein